MFSCSYNPSRSNIDFHLAQLIGDLALYSSHYENFIIGDLNVEANNSVILVFSDTYNLKSLIKDPKKPPYIDHMLINKPQSFKYSSVIKTGLSHFHRMTVTVIKAIFEKL